MLGTILGILKIIGIVVLVLLGILLTLILLVLFVPVCYRVKGALDGKPRGMGEISWLLHLISCRVTYEEGLDMAVRILGIRVGGNWLGEDEEEPVREEAYREETVREEPVREATGSEPQVLDKVLRKEEDQGEIWNEDQKEIQEEMAREAAGQRPPEPEAGRRPEPKVQPERRKPETSGPRRSPSFWSWFQPKHIWKKIRVTFQKICGKLKILMKKRKEILEFLQNEENRHTFRNIKSQLLALLRHIRPRKLTGRLRFGFEDPSKTGQILTYVSPFYGLYAKHFTLIPVFEEEVMEGELDIKGRIRLAALIWIGIQVIRDRNFRTLLKKWKAV